MPEAFAGSGAPRRTLLTAVALTPLAMAGCSAEGPTAASADGPEPGPKDALIMVIRPAKKLHAGDTGEDAEGTEDPGLLAGRDRRRAEELHGALPARLRRDAAPPRGRPSRPADRPGPAPAASRRSNR